MPRSVKFETQVRKLLGKPGDKPNPLLQDEVGQFEIASNYPYKGIVDLNRRIYLAELRSGKWKKGCMKSDEKGNPIIETPEDNEGTCACAIMLHLFSPEELTSTTRARKALGISGHDCRFIQHCLNDNENLSFPQIADIIEKTVFRKVEMLENFIYAGGEMICKICGHPYGKHPNPSNHEYLTAICDGTLVKL
jgi:hypothetical protein